MSNKNKHKQTDILFNALHTDAIDLRYRGMTYKEISKELFNKHGKYVLPQRLRAWFMTGGILHDKYAAYAKEENGERRELMQQQLRKIGMLIPKVLEETLFQPMRHPMTGQIMKDEEGNVLYMRNRTTNDAVKILSELLGARFSETDADDMEDVLDNYFKRLDDMPSVQIPEHAAT